ncbi:hypothetical protein ACFSTC_19590 [Nonomuraea ferruginea]
MPSGGKVSARLTGTDFDLDATGLEWLVITPDGKAAVKGKATVAGRSGYGFVLYGHDEPDRLRLVVWPLSQAPYPGGPPAYDNRRVERVRHRPLRSSGRHRREHHGAPLSYARPVMRERDRAQPSLRARPGADALPGTDDGDLEELLRRRGA